MTPSATLTDPEPIVADTTVANATDHPRPRPDPDALEISAVWAPCGPNYWRLAPVIACDVRLGARKGSHLPHVLEHVALDQVRRPGGAW